MSGHGGGHGKSNWKPLIEILLFIVAAWLIWYFTGGPERAAQQGDNPYLNAPNSVTNGSSF